MLTLLSLFNTIRETIAKWWSEFTLETRLMAAATLVVSLLMSGLTFWAMNTIQQDARMNDTRFGSDLGLLLAANVSPLLSEDNLQEVARFSSRFYISTSSIRYMIYADQEGKIFFGIPYSAAEVHNSLTIQRRISLPDLYSPEAYRPFVRQHLTPNGIVTDVFVPLRYKDNYLGVLALGINPNPITVASSNLTRDVTIAVFVSIWTMVILGAVFNALTITKPIKELLVGVKNIAAKNFKQRIDLPLEGELGELIANFNEMAERLESYEAQNIEELTAEKAKLDTLVSTIADGAILLDTELTIVLVNPAAREFFGWEEEPVVGKNILHKLPAELTGKLTQPLYETATSEIVLENEEEPSSDTDNDAILAQELGGSEFRLILTKPTQRTVRILMTKVLDHSLKNMKRSIKGIAITIQDITREVKLNEAKSQFISNVSHELRTPLFNIKSFIETLYEYGDELTEKERHEFLHTANHETDRLTRLVNDVLDLSRLESARKYELSEVYLDQITEQTIRSHQLNARDKKIELSHEIEPNVPPVLGHYDLLLQVFANLVGNSLKFTKSDGKILIRIYRLNARKNSETLSQVRIEIADTGIGIPSEDQDAIFDRFFRVENRVHTLEGTGLGLSIVRNIIDKHQTTMHLVSEVGVGSTFWFDLPICESQIESETSSLSSSSSTDN